MEQTRCLHELLRSTAKAVPDRIAVEDLAGSSITYGELDALSDRLRDRLRALGVRSGDRVGFYLRKSIDSIGCIFGILKAGAAYVPVDPDAPASRNAFIFGDCGVRVVVVETGFAEDLSRALTEVGASPHQLALDRGEAGLPLRCALDRLDETGAAAPAETRSSDPDELAYVLYTSGSTGKPKGVMISHENATSFVDWCSGVFEPSSEDTSSSHAPLHFDLSILDVYMPIKHGARLVLIGEEVGKDPKRLAEIISQRRITIWYSAPSTLALLAQYGKLERYDYSALRKVLFAGEVFPIKHLRRLMELLPHPRYFNLYGPTETNVCTYYEVPQTIEEGRTKPYPIGKVCSHLEGRIIDLVGCDVEPGTEGELVIRGPAVTSGYWRLPERNAIAFHRDADGRSWYKTGDLVYEEEDGNLTFVGRRDRMVKKRGYRIELGEIEAGLYQHPEIREVGVIAVSDALDDVKIKAFYSTKDAERKLSMIALKAFCAKRLPGYMIPDLFVHRPGLPLTSTGKTDYQGLRDLS
jgi:amino acid adenylation domain-containing protein